MEGRCAHTMVLLCYHPLLLFLWCPEMGRNMNIYTVLNPCEITTSNNVYD